LIINLPVFFFFPKYFIFLPPLFPGRILAFLYKCVFMVFGFPPPPPPPPAGMGKHQYGGIKRGMAENLPFPSFIHLYIP
ncbi:hypothetical protein, partial [Neisseria meningitidis]|uniref:hypothetical protein n=1 Tax=Neisseria meningitidis TaxID=487 RepID=UPI001957101D